VTRCPTCGHALAEEHREPTITMIVPVETPAIVSRCRSCGRRDPNRLQCGDCRRAA